MQTADVAGAPQPESGGGTARSDGPGHAPARRGWRPGCGRRRPGLRLSGVSTPTERLPCRGLVRWLLRRRTRRRSGGKGDSLRQCVFMTASPHRLVWNGSKGGPTRAGSSRGEGQAGQPPPRDARRVGQKGRAPPALGGGRVAAWAPCPDAQQPPSRKVIRPIKVRRASGGRGGEWDGGGRPPPRGAPPPAAVRHSRGGGARAGAPEAEGLGRRVMPRTAGGPAGLRGMVVRRRDCVTAPHIHLPSKPHTVFERGRGAVEAQRSTSKRLCPPPPRHLPRASAFPPPPFTRHPKSRSRPPAADSRLVDYLAAAALDGRVAASIRDIPTGRQ